MTIRSPVDLTLCHVSVDARPMLSPWSLMLCLHRSPALQAGAHFLEMTLVPVSAHASQQRLRRLRAS